MRVWQAVEQWQKLDGEYRFSPGNRDEGLASPPLRTLDWQAFQPAFWQTCSIAGGKR